MWCGQTARCAVASAYWPVALGNRDNPIAELYEWGKQHDGHIDVLASGRYPINAAVETGIPASRDFHSNADRSRHLKTCILAMKTTLLNDYHGHASHVRIS